MIITDQVIAVGLKEGKSVDDFAPDFRQALAGLSTEDTVFALADIVGGAPLTSAFCKRFCQNLQVEHGSRNLVVSLDNGTTGLVMKDIMEDLAQATFRSIRSLLQEL